MRPGDPRLDFFPTLPGTADEEYPEDWNTPAPVLATVKRAAAQVAG